MIINLPEVDRLQFRQFNDVLLTNDNTRILVVPNYNINTKLEKQLGERAYKIGVLNNILSSSDNSSLLWDQAFMALFPNISDKH